MAIEPGFIGNNSQGLAYVLPNSRTEQYAIQLNQERAAQQRAQAALLQKQQNDENDAYAKHLYDNKIPDHNAQWDAAINPVFQKYTKDAADYHTKTGKDAFAQPEFVQRRNDLLSMASNSKQAAQKAVGLSTLLNNDRDNKLDPNDKQKIAQALVDYNADPVKNFGALNGLTASAKPYDITDAQKLLKPVTLGDNNGYFDITKPDRHKHVVQSQEILSDPKFTQLKIKNGINPNVGDIFNIQDADGTTHYPTDEPTVRRFAQHVLAEPTSPGSIATLQAAGIDPADIHAEQKLTELGMRQNTGYGKLVGGLADYADARAKSDKTRVFGAYRMGMAEERLNMAAERLKMAKEGQVATGIPKDQIYPYQGGVGHVLMKGAIGITSPKMNFGGTPAINMDSGEKEKDVLPSGDYQVVTIANVPFTTVTTKTNKGEVIPAGSIAQPDFAASHPNSVKSQPMLQIQGTTSGGHISNHLIDANRLPANVPKSLKQAISNFKPDVAQQGVNQPKSHPIKLSKGSLNDL